MLDKKSYHVSGLFAESGTRADEVIVVTRSALKDLESDRIIAIFCKPDQKTELLQYSKQKKLAVINDIFGQGETKRKSVLFKLIAFVIFSLIFYGGNRVIVTPLLKSEGLSIDQPGLIKGYIVYCLGGLSVGALTGTTISTHLNSIYHATVKLQKTSIFEFSNSFLLFATILLVVLVGIAYLSLRPKEVFKKNAS